MNERSSIQKYKRIVVKVGTTTLTHSNGRINLQRIEKLSWVVTDLHDNGLDVVLVSSGAIAVGVDRLGLPSRPRDIQGKQAASAVGQGILMQIYESFFNVHNQKIAQILLTKDVMEEPVRREHAKNTFAALLGLGVIPIVNENDTVAVDELEFSDNDTLSAYVANLVAADALIILSDIDGLYPCDPKTNPDAKRLTYVETITEAIENMAAGAGSELGTGGMTTKILAGKMVIPNGVDMIIASGNDPTILLDIMAGNDKGTFFKGVRK